MELKLDKNLAHQTAPVDGVATVVEASIKDAPQRSNRNPLLARRLNEAALTEVRQRVGILQKAMRQRVTPYMLSDRIKALPPHSLLDIKMETGTGKTYVYTRTMYELHRRCGINKFVIAVPTLPIKAGTAAFIADPAVQRHFKDVCGYRAEIELCLIEPQKQKKKGRLNMPPPVGRFFYGTHHEAGKIYVLLLNTQLLTSGKLLTRDDYDQMLGSYHRPVDAIADTRPVLIIDEPHRVERGGKSYAALIEGLRPQLVLRYGATFPELTVGKGKGKHTVKDYQELIYDLTAADSFNQGLIKGVAKEHLSLPGARKAEKKVRVMSAVRGGSASLRLTDADGRVRQYAVCQGDSLGMVDADLDGVTVEAVTKNGIALSNGQEKLVGEEFFPDQFGASYQEGMIELALMRHFETERANFCRDGLPIKTLALFFIDSIESYRGPEGKNDGWLRQMFLTKLEQRVKLELARSNTPEYAAYLKATLERLDATCAGYFAQDNNDSDEGIANEVKLILHGKKSLLSFTDDKGQPNVLRFLFSKWTLKEGWDNPNVFTICKLRSSGSETSKLQEVGRGLRLPVDSAGNRISDSSFMLNYIVDFTEKDFATRLVAEINGEMGQGGKAQVTISADDITEVAMRRGVAPNKFMAELLMNGYMGVDNKIADDRFDDLMTEYPEFRDVVGGVGASRIVDRSGRVSDKVHVRKARFEELRTLWMQLNRKYVLFFDREIEGELEKVLPQLLVEKQVFAVQTATSERSLLGFEERMAVAKEGTFAELTLQNRHYAYGEFLKRASQLTGVPAAMLHKAVCRAAADGAALTDEMFNSGSLTRLAVALDDWKCSRLTGFVRYRQADYTARETKLTNADGSVKGEVVQAYIGTKCAAGVPPERYLYDAYAHDSGLELQNMRTEIDEVVVYGKIPSHSICIPTVASSNYSPDFMYVVKRADGSKELNVVIETKAYDKESHISQDEQTKISCAEQFFKAMSECGYKVHFRKQINGIGVKNIIGALMSKD